MHRLDYVELYAKLVEELRDFAIFFVSEDGRITTWNSGVEAILGYTEAEFVGQPISMIFTPEDVAAGAPAEECRTALAEGRAPDQRWHVRKNGTRLFVDGVLTAVRDDNGDLIGLSKIMRDKTREKQIEYDRERLVSELKAQNQRSNEILESISDAFYAIDREFRFTYVNRKAEELWHRCRHELIGRHIWTEFPSAAGTESYAKHVDAMSERRPISYEVVSPVLKRWVHVSIYPSANGGLSCYFQDISERKETDAEREKLMAELSRSNEDLRQFAYVLSHDLQAPLRMVKSYTELLDRRCGDKVDATGREFLNFIREGSQRMEEFIHGLLTYAQASDATHRQPVSITGVVEGVIAIFTDAIRDVDATVTCDVLPTVVGDPVQLLQLVQNLIGNALKYRRPGVRPTIHVAAEPRNETEWLFSVRDNGLGIDEKDADHIFLPLKRLHGHDIPGTGIGLAICKRVVERHGGRIWVESKPGHGSTFYFTFPRSSA